MSYETKLDILKNKIISDSLLTSPDKIEHGIYLFISFDLVNSTHFKEIKGNENTWPFIISYFYNVMVEEISELYINAKVWKYLGDEIIFQYCIDNIDTIYDAPEKIFEIQGRVIHKIKEKFSTKKTLDIKGTIWIAGITYSKSGSIDDFSNIAEAKDLYYRNIGFKLQCGDYIINDFLGPDIDTGFRIAKFANKRKITISAEYAYLLLRMGKPSKCKQIDKKIKIVSFEELKGIWDGRAYPIIWYYPDWKDNDDNGFDYDEFKNNDIVRNINHKKNIDYLESVFDQIEKTNYLNLFVEECKKLRKPESDLLEVPKII